jgi:hypothetical protein
LQHQEQQRVQTRLNNIWLICFNLLVWQSYHFNSYYQQHLHHQQVQINDLKRQLGLRGKELDAIRRQLNMEQQEVVMDDDHDEEIIETVVDQIPEVAID